MASLLAFARATYSPSVLDFTTDLAFEFHDTAAPLSVNIKLIYNFLSVGSFVNQHLQILLIPFLFYYNLYNNQWSL
jgi:hypothetical protein